VPGKWRGVSVTGRRKRLSDWLKNLSKTLWLTPEFPFLKLEAISRRESEQNTHTHVRSPHEVKMWRCWREWLPISRVSPRVLP